MPDLPLKVKLLTMAPVALAVIFGIVVLLIIVRQSAKNDAMPIETVHVRLAKKKKIFHGGRHRHYTELLFFFLTDDGELLEFNVSNSLDFDFYNEGDTGMLTYQGTRFLKFERDHVNISDK